MTNITSFIARRYLTFKEKNKQIMFMLRLCFCGITIGSFALMLTLIIMHGFETVIHEKMQGITAPLIIHAPGDKIDETALQPFLKTAFENEIEACSASSLRQVLLKKNNQHIVLFLRGVDAFNEGKVSTIEEKLIKPAYHKGVASPSLATLLPENQILIGHKLAAQHHLDVGDEVILLIPEPASSKKIVLSERKALIAGIFKVGLEEYDNNFAYSSLDFLRKLFDEKRGVDQITLKLKTPSTSWWSNLIPHLWPFQEDFEQLTIKKLQDKCPGLSVHSWKDLYPALVSSLKLEKYVMFFIIALITLVASMNMISLLFMQIQQKRRDIAILKTMGASAKTITRIFLRMGMLITTLASCTGLTLAALVGYFLERFPFIQLPDVYYISYLPARMEAHLFVMVFLCTILLGFIASWWPAYRTKYINITEVLRHE